MEDFGPEAEGLFLQKAWWDSKCKEWDWGLSKSAPAAHDIQKLLGMLENNSPGTAINILMRDVANMNNSKVPKSHLK